jgi:hypothetical protein
MADDMLLPDGSPAAASEAGFVVKPILGLLGAPRSFTVQKWPTAADGGAGDVLVVDGLTFRRQGSSGSSAGSGAAPVTRAA